MRQRKYRIVAAGCSKWNVEYKDRLVWWTASYNDVYVGIDDIEFGSKELARAWIDNDIAERKQAAENRRRRDECIDEEPEYYP